MLAGVRAHHWLMPQLALETGSSLPPFAFDVLAARRATRDPTVAVLRAE